MKPYQGEKAIISLTSWKARIHEVAKTIFTLRKHNPDFHIVLVLSEDEFPKKEAELPDDVNILANADIIEILWVKPNLKAFKKLLPTQAKYPEVPIIIADDGLIYKTNHAEMLYDYWQEDPTAIYAASTYSKYGFKWGCGGWGIIFPPGCFTKFYPACLTDDILATNHDDALYGVLAKKLNMEVKQAGNGKYWEIAYETKDGVSSSMNRQKRYNDSCIPSMYKILENL